VIGECISHYQILEKLGRGGMGEVFLATDLSLGRKIALKFLPDLFTGNSERMARFEREAKLLASLNHPNIAAIHELGEAHGKHFLVLEFVEGATLAQSLSKGPFSIEESLRVCRQIAEGLEAAHEKGIIHRDLKPANIKVTPEGKVKVLDFGLAKASEGEITETDGSDSPTLSISGAVLGTAAYMSPEQARGSQLDWRCDIWSFGVVLFEMLTGKRLFAGETISDTLAAVIRAEIDWNVLPVDTPGSIRALLRRCLTKDRKQRLQAIGDARIAIEEYLANPAGTTEPETAAITGRHGPREKLAWCIAIVFVVATAVLSVKGILDFRKARVEEPEIRFEVITPPTSDPTGLTLSPDGRLLAFVASAEGQPRLWLRPLDSAAAQPLAGTEGATDPFWSPDSQSIGFFAGDKLRRIHVAGGPPQTLASAPNDLGGTWNRDGLIVFAPSWQAPLYRVPALGGNPLAITQLDPPHHMAHGWPQFLPDGRHLLFFASGADSGIYLGSLDSDEIRLLIAADTTAVYAPPGYLLFMRQRTLFAQRFDATRLDLIGDAVPIADSVAFNSTNNIGGFSVSETGMLAYRAASGAARRCIAWFDRSGKEVGTLGGVDENNLRHPELSPDGRRLAIDRTVQRNADVWLIDTMQGVPSRFTFDGAADSFPIWSPDGSRIIFCSNRKGSFDLYQKASSGAGDDELLLESALDEFPNDWSPDGRFVLYVQVEPKTGFDIMVLPLFGARKPYPFVNTSFSEGNAQFSPDGRWVAYQSNESGRSEIYVQPFLGPGGKWQVSTNGGIEPRWSRDGKELFFIAPDAKLMAAPIKFSGESPKSGVPEALFQTRIVDGGQIISAKHQYAVAPNGQRFLINVTVNESTVLPITIITNWARTLKK
jgi:serine/threonine protein kinase